MREDDISATPLIPTFTPAHYAKLCENEYFRYMPNSDVIGHALVGPDGRAMQFALPDNPPGLVAPLTGELSQLMQFDLPNNKKTVLGFVDQTPMISRRAYNLSIAYPQEDPVDYIFYPLSPKKNPVTQEDRPIFYDTTRVERFQNTAAVQDEIARIDRVKKTGSELVINNARVPVRMTQRRAVDQNTVMGRHMMQQLRTALRRHRHEHVALPSRASHSAVEEMAGFLEQYRDLLTRDMIQILEKSVRAPLTGHHSQNRGEWLHRNSHNLHPLTIDPQRADNLGAAEKEYNTEMMIGERKVQFFALNLPCSRSTIKCDFDMLLDSEMIDMIHFVSCVQVAGFTFKITQHIDCFQREPQCVKASDLASLMGILFCFMHKQAPRSVQGVSIGRTDRPIDRFSGNFFQVKRENSAVREDSGERLLLQGP